MGRPVMKNTFEECPVCFGRYAHTEECSTLASPEEIFAPIRVGWGGDPGDEQQERPDEARLELKRRLGCTASGWGCKVPCGRCVPPGVVADPVNNPPHYKAAGLEAIEVIEAFAGGNYHRGAALKYLLRAGRKGDTATDLRKALWHINRELTQ